MFKGMSNIYKQAQKMQKDMKKVQDELEDLNVEGQAGGGIIKVVVNGKKEPKSVTIDSSVLDEDKEMIEDLVLAAMKNAFDNADKESSEKMKSITGGMPNIPGLMNIYPDTLKN